MLDPARRAEGVHLPSASREIIIPPSPPPHTQTFCVWSGRLCASLAIVAVAIAMILTGSEQKLPQPLTLVVLGGLAARSTMSYLRVRSR